MCTEYNGRAGNPGGRHEPEKVLPSVLGYQRSSWGGNPSNVYDTTRAASLGSSSGSGVSVSANLCMVSLGEETRASCRGPANHNSTALILPHKAMIGFDGGAIGADIYCDRTGIFALHARRDGDTVTVAVADHGQWRPAAQRPTLLGGRGLPLIHTLADEAAVESSAAGTTVTMTWTRDP